MPIVTLSDLNKKSSTKTPTPKRKSTSSTPNTIHTLDTPTSNKRSKTSTYIGSGIKHTSDGKVKLDFSNVAAETEHDRHLAKQANTKQKLNLTMTPDIRLFMYERRIQPKVTIVCTQQHKLKQSELNDVWKIDTTVNQEIQTIMENTHSISNGVLAAKQTFNIEQIAELYQIKCPVPHCPEYIQPTLTINDLYTDTNKYIETVPYLSKSQLKQQCELYIKNSNSDYMMLGRLVQHSPLILWNAVKHYGTIDNAMKQMYTDSTRSVNRNWTFYNTANQLV